jgi:hypothetical protein
MLSPPSRNRNPSKFDSPAKPSIAKLFRIFPPLNRSYKNLAWVSYFAYFV